jgi:hypothetical protein
MKKLLYLVAFTAASGSILGQGDESLIEKSLARVVGEFANKMITIPAELAEDGLQLEANFLKLCADKLRSMSPTFGKIAEDFNNLATRLTSLRIPQGGVRTSGSQMVKMLRLKGLKAALTSDILHALIQQTDKPDVQEALLTLANYKDKKANFIRKAIRGIAAQTTKGQAAEEPSTVVAIPTTAPEEAEETRRTKAAKRLTPPLFFKAPLT